MSVKDCLNTENFQIKKIFFEITKMKKIIIFKFPIKSIYRFKKIQLLYLNLYKQI